MSESAERRSVTDISDVTSQQSSTGLQRIINTQPFWVFVALIIICIFMGTISDTFLSERNLFTTTRNFAFMAIVALGMTTVIVTGGIDLSVGSVMGLSGIMAGITLAAGYPLWLGLVACLLSAMAAGAVNGFLIAYLRMSPFVVTLGMLAIARSLALVVSNNRMFYQFGPDEGLFLAIGGGRLMGLANPVWALIVLTLVFMWLYRYSTWGRHVFAIGGNMEAAKLSGIPVERVLMSVYMVSGLMAGIASFLMVGWLGSVTNALGQTYELQVIAATVIGGANLMGGSGYAIGAPIGAALVEVIRNSLLLAGVDPYWQGTFLGGFIILAVLLEKIRGRRME
ncbi:ABC transporter permease [Nitratireductor sp. GCM10026969]|uniref:ABC transporter permease n=1 Tax=Nitratireductor sp. GCM10026969 TaxID=3252645 RepID=UPI0036176234